jgi:hypothetical protein
MPRSCYQAMRNYFQLSIVRIDPGIPSLFEFDILSLIYKEISSFLTVMAGFIFGSRGCFVRLIT